MARTKQLEAKRLTGSAVGPVDLDKKPRKKPRWKPKTVARREITKYQRSTDLLIPRACFNRCVRQIADRLEGTEGMRWRPEALLALQHAAESHVASVMRDTRRINDARGGVTIHKKDMVLARLLNSNPPPS